MKKKLIYLSVLSTLGTTMSAQAADFTNGGFETAPGAVVNGSVAISGWTQGGGTFTTPLTAPYIMNPNSYSAGTSNNTVITIANTSTRAYDPLLHAAGVDIDMVYNGLQSVRVNDSNNNKSISTISQTVTAYGGNSINLAWSAVLQYAVHPEADTDNFTLLVEDLSAGTTIRSISYNAVTAAGTFSSVNAGGGIGVVYYSGWRTETISTIATHNYRISLLAADCDAGGHFGYVYLDAFGTSALASNIGVTAPAAVVGAALPNIVVANNAPGFNLLSNVAAGTSFNNVFDGGTLKVGADGTTTATFTITSNNGTIDQYGNAATFNGIISNASGAGSLTIANGVAGGAGGITFGGINTYTGTTTINSGATLALSGSGSIATSSGVVADGTLNVSDTNTGATITTLSGSGSVVTAASKGLTLSAAAGTFSGAISGAGGLTVAAGTETLSGTNTYTGTTTINSGATLALSGSGSIATSSGVVANGTLNVSGTTSGATITTLSGSGSVVTAANKGLTLSAAAGTFSGAISGAGGLTVAAGTETLSGTNTYTGTTTIDSGATLALSASGSIATSSGVTNNGTLRVTAATGNIALGGTYTQSTGGSLLMNFSATNNQQINVSNTATLAGNLAITASAGTYNVGRYTLITASNGVSGTFNSFDGSSFSNLSADYSNYALGYDANNVYLNLYPTAANTQASIESNLAALRGAYNLANIAMNNNLNQDCSFFNEYGFCASLIGSHTSIAGSKDTDMTDGILVLAKKMDEHFRIGAYLDQTINIHNNSYVHLRNDGPGFGGFAVWNRQADGFGAQLRASAGRSSKDLSVTRQVVGNAEAGTGKTDFDSYGAAIVASYAVEATDDLNMTPYVGVRWTKVTADAYTEDSAAFAPLNFAALSQSATTLMGGLKVNKAINENAAAYASFALEQDIHNNGGSYSASSANIAGITPVAFNQDINKVRPVVNAGTQYNIDRRQRIGADVIWSEQAFTKNDSTTLMVRYTLGL